ncbi:uncharacterized protein BYT42DRAFT_559986 [Radiomyces spectabilis]|uniref:uncharacterized protein n=1 Tax=Radiomyces spectabilis TaxID=64574 RepID=UPI002220A99A|nr:uncharacterized protein BYT42DRAFT_559986 [Radiomyces spectabilis]KAI8388416.1 hypothetical protein BYT42DRAFT_559986 [Radiomyces spectabilis]
MRRCSLDPEFPGYSYFFIIFLCSLFLFFSTFKPYSHLISHSFRHSISLSPWLMFLYSVLMDIDKPHYKKAVFFSFKRSQ